MLAQLKELIGGKSVEILVDLFEGVVNATCVIREVVGDARLVGLLVQRAHVAGMGVENVSAEISTRCCLSTVERLADQVVGVQGSETARCGRVLHLLSLLLLLDGLDYLLAEGLGVVRRLPGVPHQVEVLGLLVRLLDLLVSLCRGVGGWLESQGTHRLPRGRASTGAYRPAAHGFGVGTLPLGQLSAAVLVVGAVGLMGCLLRLLGSPRVQNDLFVIILQGNDAVLAQANLILGHHLCYFLLIHILDLLQI